MSGVEVHDDRRMYDAIMREIKKLSSAAITVGIHGDVGAEPKKDADGKEGITSNIDVAYAHEFGKGVPERSYLRTTVDARKSELFGFAEDQAVSVIHGKMPAKKASDRIGVVFVGMVKETIENRATKPYGPLSPERVRQRQKKGAHGGGLASKFGEMTPLHDTGQLIQSIQYRTEGV